MRSLARRLFLHDLLFGRGAFDDRSLRLTYTALIFHGMALVPIAWYRILIQVFYAHKQVKVTVVLATLAAVVNVVGCFLLPTLFDPALRHCGVPLATCLSTWLLFLLASFLVRRRYALLPPRANVLEILKIVICAAAFVPVWLPGMGSVLGPVSLFLRIALSILIYLVLLVLLRVSSLSRLRRSK